MVILPRRPAKTLGLRELFVKCLRPSPGAGIVGLGGIDQLRAIDPKLVECDGTKIDKTHVPLQRQRGAHLTIENAEREPLESRFVGNVVEHGLHERTVDRAACIERWNDISGTVGDRAEPRIAPAGGVEGIPLIALVMHPVKGLSSAPFDQGRLQ